MEIRPLAIVRTLLAAGALAALALTAPGALLPVGSARAGEELPPATGTGPERAGDYFWVETATVVSVDPDEQSVTVEEPEGRFTYLVRDTTLVRKNGETVALEALEAGDRLAISAHEGQDVEERPIADTIQVLPSG